MEGESLLLMCIFIIVWPKIFICSFFVWVTMQKFLFAAFLWLKIFICSFFYMGNCAKIFTCSFFMAQNFYLQLFYMGNCVKINFAQKAQAILCVCLLY